jgi:predicted phosphoribosyltransferase
MSVGAWYQDFHQLPESEVLDILAEARRRTASLTQVREPRATLAW